MILITAYGTIDSAVLAMKEGASDYLTKPFSLDELLLLVKRLLRMRQLEEENLSASQKSGRTIWFRGIGGEERSDAQDL